MRIVGYHVSNKIAANSDGEVVTSPPYLDFLLEPKPDTIKVFYHIGYNIANLLKAIDITKEEAQKLHDAEQLFLSPYKLKHAAGRFFGVSKGAYFSTFCDMNQYTPANLQVDDTVESCLAKARTAKETGEQVYTTLSSLSLHPTTLTSPVRAFEKEVLSRMKLPTVDDIPEDAGYYAYQCCKGNWLEAFQVGHWEQAWDYDISSAYAAELAQLLDLRLGEWKHTSYFVPGATYGYCKGKVTINAPFSPVMHTKTGTGFDSLNYTPVGTWETYLTKREIEFIQKWQLGSFEIEDGWWWVTTTQKQILKGTVNWLHLQKESVTGLSREVIKRVMAGIYGKFLEVRGRDTLGAGFNPVYGAEVETNTRLKVAELVLQNRENVIHIAVDGVLLSKPVQLNLNGNGNRIGEWRLSYCAPCIVTGTGVAAIKGKEGTNDFSLSYDWLLEQIRQHPELNEYKTSKMSPVTLAVALNRNWEKLGQLHEVVRTVDVGGEMKRCYLKRPKCGQDLLNRQYGSEPWDISMVSRLT